jgi:DNA repair protein RadA/Sms
MRELKDHLQHETRRYRLNLGERAAPMTERGEVAVHLPRMLSGIYGFDLVCGGADEPGQEPRKTHLISGEPGTGKSSILLQAVAGYALRGLRPMIATSEEDREAVIKRAIKMGLRGLARMFVIATENWNVVERAVRANKPRILVSDSLDRFIVPGARAERKGGDAPCHRAHENTP